MLGLGIPSAVTAETAAGLDGRLIVGYQGWFGCPGDFGTYPGWSHWFFHDKPEAANFAVDSLPVTDGLPASALCPTGLAHADGSPISLFTAQDPGLVALHFRWMESHGIDGAALQRFLKQVEGQARLERSDHLLREERDAAEEAHRVFYVTYDISGLSPANAIDAVRSDWRHLVDDMKITSSPAYLRVDGKPVLEVWGFGFTDRPGEPAEVEALIHTLENGDGGQGGVKLIGGIPAYWRTLDRDSKGAPAWGRVYRAFDVISPWATGRFTDDASADSFLKETVAPDLAVTKSLGIGYLPVIFPGMSASHLHRGRGQTTVPGAVLNRVPRRCGDFLWHQVHNLSTAGVRSLYVAMFDEVDEGTALIPIESGPGRQPKGTEMLSRDQEGCSLPPDWYLRVAGQAALVLQGRSTAREPLSAVLVP
jgi:hypothetical protein